MPNGNNKDSMDELNKIIDRYTEGNYLIGKTDKEKMAKDILALFSVSQQRKLLEWLSNEDYFNIPKDEINEILEDCKTYNSNCG